MKTIYKYKIWNSFFTTKLSDEDLNKYLNEVGKEGYKLIQIFNNNFIFIKEINIEENKK